MMKLTHCSGCYTIQTETYVICMRRRPVLDEDLPLSTRSGQVLEILQLIDSSVSRMNEQTQE